MGVKVRVGFGVAAVLLLVWMTTLFIVQPTITYHSVQPVVHAKCGSVVGAGDLAGGGHGALLVTDVVDTDNSPDVTLTVVYRDCDRLRTSRVGAMAFLAVPTAVLAVLAIAFRRRVDPATP